MLMVNNTTYPKNNMEHCPGKPTSGEQ